MNPKTLTALRGSIKKWRGIVAGKIIDGGVGDCPLCKLFRQTNDGCSGCPVAAAADNFCRKTPYSYWEREGRGFGHTADTPLRKRLAQAELNFLIGLLPEKRKKQ
jgi:hypothetical protein